jgi:hypothetical protein
MNKNLYIVPYDFTAVGDAALNYALYLGNKVEVDIIILYIAKSTSDATHATAKLTQLISTLNPPTSVNLTHVVKEGSIFEDIASVALKKNAHFLKCN